MRDINARLLHMADYFFERHFPDFGALGLEANNEIERLRKALDDVLDLIEPWATHCDYRAEDNIQAACEAIILALKEGK